MKRINELDDELCDHCAYTDYGQRKVGTGTWNMCEGSYCETAYEHYVESFNDYGFWVIHGPEALCHPIIGHAEGYYQDVLEYAATLDGWFYRNSTTIHGEIRETEPIKYVKVGGNIDEKV